MNNRNHNRKNHRIGLYLLLMGAFAAGTAELVIGGILDRVAADLNVSIGTAGQLITAFSLAFAIGTPILVALTFRLSRRRVLLVSLAAFAVGNALDYVGTNLPLLFAARALLGASAGLFSVVAFSGAAKLAAPGRAGSAVGLVALGFSLATVLGVPLGAIVADAWNWRASFLLLGSASLIVLAAMVRWMPEMEGDEPVPFARQLAVLRNPAIVGGLFLSASFTASSSLMNSYLIPFVREQLGWHEGSVSLLLLIVGVAGVIGSRTGGWAVDRIGAMRTIASGLLLCAVSLVALPLLAGETIPGTMLIALWSFGMTATIPAVMTYFISQAPDSSNLVLGLNNSVLHLGVAIGAAGGGALADSAMTVRYHPVAAGALALIGLGAGLVSFRITNRLNARRAAADSGSFDIAN